MIEVLGLMTCYNRKDKTVRALHSLVSGNPNVNFSFLIVDDGSTDGTSDELKKMKNVQMIRGTGNLFYSGAMRIAIKEAKKECEKYDYFLMFNDDVDFFEHSIEKLCMRGNSGIWVGATCDEKGQLTYGGVVKTSKWRPKTQIIMSDPKEEKRCDTFNANCVIIPKEIFMEMENIDEVYSHSMGDFDFGFAAGRKGFKMVVSDEFVGECHDNPIKGSWRNTQLSFGERVRRKESPKGLPAKEWYHYLKKNYNIVTAIVYSCIPYIRIMLKK